METVTVKFQENVLKNIDKSIAEHDFNSRTEFIRESVRDKLSELNKNDLVKATSDVLFDKEKWQEI